MSCLAAEGLATFGEPKERLQSAGELCDGRFGRTVSDKVVLRQS